MPLNGHDGQTLGDVVKGQIRAITKESMNEAMMEIKALKEQIPLIVKVEGEKIREQYSQQIQIVLAENDKLKNTIIELQSGITKRDELAAQLQKAVHEAQRDLRDQAREHANFITHTDKIDREVLQTFSNQHEGLEGLIGKVHHLRNTDGLTESYTVTIHEPPLTSQHLWTEAHLLSNSPLL